MTYQPRQYISNVGTNGSNFHDTKSIATLDQAYIQSDSMKNFQDKMMSHNPLLSQNLVDNPNETQSINNGIDAILRANKLDTENGSDKMDKNIDEVIGSVYEKNTRKVMPVHPPYVMEIKPYGMDGFGLFKIILLLILLAALLYGGYWLYNNYKENNTAMATSQKISIKNPK